MGIVVDSDILIDLLREKDEAVKKIKELEKNEELATTDINVFELYYGAYKSNKKDKNLSSTRGLLKNLTLLHTTEEAMETGGRIYSDMKAKGKSIDIRDVLIAAITLQNGASLLTRNREHFERIEELVLVD
ncbi:MAG: type II toxin-antitoxin system VapC family toxin [Euryarchaeota archaeon]|nr:type II toxin-antitoxin system VapC family toxin [Euryarchaeota archaeon]MCG2736362.1 type II toxin-antitoxin system VapC family toxin [Candidatus Methanoperedenaceae archaeon]